MAREEGGEGSKGKGKGKGGERREKKGSWRKGGERVCVDVGPG